MIFFRDTPLRLGVSLGILLALVFLLKSFAVVIPLAIVTAVFASGISSGARHWRAICLGALCFAGPVLAWVFARYSHDGWQFFAHMLWADAVERTVTGVEGHAKGQFYYLLRVCSHMPEWIAVGAIALIAARRASPLPLVLKHRVLLAWALMPLLIASLMQTKISWYINSFYPALALLLGVLLVHAGSRFPRTVTSLVALALVVAEVRIVGRIIWRDEIPAAEVAARTLPVKDLASPSLTQVQRFVIVVDRRGR
jgi:4-amino-4-deoxy-L-arabinose transferase-like glycosyltransferase